MTNQKKETVERRYESNYSRMDQVKFVEDRI